MAYDTVKQLLEQESNKTKIENGAVNRIETINIDDELEDEGAVEDDEADDDIEKRGSILFQRGKENVSTHQANGTPESSLLQMKMITIQYSETPS